MDDLTPMDPAEILEMKSAPEQPPQEGGYYGTCPEKKKKKHVGLIVFICVLAVVLAGIIAFLSIYEIQIERTDGGFSMRVVSRGQQPEKSTQPDNSQTPTDNGPGSTSDKNNNPPDGTRPQLNITDTPQASGTASDAMTLQEIYRKVIPSVVSITVSSGYGADETGTGVIMADDGYIITNYHVVNGAGNITVLLYDDSQYTGTLLAYDELSDLAVVKINADDLTAATFGDSDALQVGDSVVAIGDPLGAELRGTMTNGIISAINRDLNVNGVEMTLIQTNAALNTGNSGGPLINCYGQVIGINTAKISGYYTSEAVEGLGFAIPIATVKEIVDELLENGYVSGRATLGVTVADMDELQRVYLGLPQGAYITGIDTTSNAYAAGVRYGDIIVSVNGTDITSTSDYTAALSSLSPGDSVELVVYRNGAMRTVQVVLQEQTG